ncbi:uncharacterized protein LOC142242854 [Haematobia irritans]|uniref:uncharacterized protein LOC142242854 n=1 Tax=Haematobia irritans TaxID=7368 RepID=UPI003F4F9CE6
MPNGEEITQPSPSLEELKQRRASSKGSMTRIKNVVEGKNTLGIIESYYKQASYYQNQIERLSPLDDGRADIDELYITIKTKLLDLIGSGRRHSITEQSFSVPQHSSSRLPSLKLPKFDGKYLEYKNFINTFNNLVHKDPNIPVTEKFNHLLSCLSGEALSTIKAFQVTDENYQSALDRLKERYDNDTLIFLENVTSMFEISKSSKPVPKQLRNIVDTISALYSSLKSLGSYEQICDAFIIHLAMSKVDPETKQKWDEFIDYSKLPSWTDCCSMLDRRCQQLDAQCRRTSKQRTHFVNKKHHSLQHKQEEQEETPTASSASTHGTFRQNSDSQISNVILETALVLIRDSEGNFRMGRALLDSCSQVNFITESFSNSLNLRKSKNTIDILGIGASGVKVSYRTQSTVRSRLNNFELSLDFLISPKITGYHPNENLSITDFNLPNNIELADPEFHRRRGIDMLLGAESFFSLLSVGQIRFGENLPTLQKTLLGWIVSGRYKRNRLNRPSKTSYVVSGDVFSKINNNVEMLWKLESVEGKRQPFSLEQQEYENHFVTNVSVQNDRKILVRLPLKEDPIVLGDSRDIALQYEELGHMSPVDENAISHPNYYIPHHCVLRPQSVSTKLRVVFDASSSQLSLNDIMMVGPTIQNQLLITLLRFRCHRYGLTADIEKMYRQVLIHPDDRHLQLILWRDNSTNPIKTYTLNTVTYGTVSAPYLAIRSLHYAAEQFPNIHECGKAVVTKDFYVDDMITAADDLHTLQLIKKEVTEILTHSNFSLSKWHSNCLNLNLTDAGIKEVRIDDDSTSTLGISWYTSDDTFHFEFRPLKSYSHQNPADVVSRGCSVIELENSNWFYGPSFLRSSESEWPPFDGPNISEEEMTIEKRKTILLAQQEDVPYIVQAVHKFSNYLKCLRVFSYLLRFQSRKFIHCLTISPDELSHSLHRIIWEIQQHYFANEIKQINNSGTLPSHLSSLALFLQEVDGVELVRVGGRLLNSDLPEDMKFPFLLPKSDPFVKIMVNHFHQSNYHAGPRALVSLIQQQFWIINCRSLARQVVYNCIHCTRYKPKLLTQVMGNLAKDRVSGSRPFQVVGVDFAGPIATYLRIRGNTPYKSYIAAFVCFTTKAVHLEAVSDLSSDAFMAALKRFIGRRGLPSKIYCDNATNFIGAESKLKAPHFGGLWEAAVKSAKGHLFRALPNARLTFEELSTALVEIEAIMNSRPISPASTDPNDLQALTPGHFLIGCPLLSLPERTNFDSDISHLQSWQRIFAQELNVNDMVIVHEDNVPPMKWITGRVTNIVPGTDGYARVDVRTPTNLLRRPVAKLAKLPID